MFFRYIFLPSLRAFLVCIEFFPETFHLVWLARDLTSSQSTEVRDLILSSFNIAMTNFFFLGVVQTALKGFEYNGESSLDLQYAMGLVNPQPIKLLQVGDLLEG